MPVKQYNDTEIYKQNHLAPQHNKWKLQQTDCLFIGMY